MIRLSTPQPVSVSERLRIWLNMYVAPAQRHMSRRHTCNKTQCKVYAECDSKCDTILSEFQFLPCKRRAALAGKVYRSRAQAGIWHGRSVIEQGTEARSERYGQSWSKWGGAETWFWIHGPDEELGCSFFSRPRSRRSSLVCTVRSYAWTIIRQRGWIPKKDSPMSPIPCLWHQRMHSAESKLVGLSILILRSNGWGWLSRIASSQILSNSGADWCWLNPKKILQICLLPTLVVWLQPGIWIGRNRNKWSNGTHTLSYIWSTSTQYTLE